MASWSGVGVNSRRSERFRRSGSRSRWHAAPRRPGASTPCGRTRRPAARRGRSAPRDRRRSVIPCATATALPSSTRPETRARRSGRSQTRPWVRPVSAPTRFVEALKVTLRHWRTRVGRGRRRHAGARARLRQQGDLVDGIGRGSYGPKVVSPSRPTGRRPARAACPPGTRRPADHALDVGGERLLVADAVHDGRDGAVRERVRRCADRRIGVHRLGGDDPEVAGRNLGRIARRARPPEHVTRAGQLQSVLIDSVDVRFVPGRTPTLRRRPAPRGSPRTASRRRRSQPRRFSSALRSQQPPERELPAPGQARRPQDEHERHEDPTTTMREPLGRSSSPIPDSASARNSRGR